MSVRKQHAACRERVDIRRDCLRVPTQYAYPVVEIVDGDEQHIGSVGALSLRRENRRHEDGQRD